MAKKNGWDMGDYTVTEEDLKAYIWCIRNNIHISPRAIREARWTIDITNKGKTNADPNSYIKSEIWEKIYNYYKHYYNKYENICKR